MSFAHYSLRSGIFQHQAGTTTILPSLIMAMPVSASIATLIAIIIARFSAAMPASAICSVVVAAFPGSTSLALVKPECEASYKL